LTADFSINLPIAIPVGTVPDLYKLTCPANAACLATSSVLQLISLAQVVALLHDRASLSLRTLCHGYRFLRDRLTQPSIDCLLLLQIQAVKGRAEIVERGLSRHYLV
jgi:hypothetical protein